MEQQRRYHEERERLLDALVQVQHSIVQYSTVQYTTIRNILVQERLAEKKTSKDGINSEHRQKAMLDRYGSVICLSHDFIDSFPFSGLLTVLQIR